MGFHDITDYNNIELELSFNNQAQEGDKLTCIQDLIIVVFQVN